MVHIVENNVFKSYSPCKIVSLIQTLKSSKTCQKRLSNASHITVHLFGKRLQKHVILEKSFLESAKLATMQRL